MASFYKDNNQWIVGEEVQTGEGNWKMLYYNNYTFVRVNNGDDQIINSPITEIIKNSENDTYESFVEFDSTVSDFFVNTSGSGSWNGDPISWSDINGDIDDNPQLRIALESKIDSANVSSIPAPNSIPQRTSNGQVKTTDAQAPNDAVNLGQVSEMLPNSGQLVPAGGTNGQVLKRNSGGGLIWDVDNNTTYTVIPESEIDTGTATTARSVSAQRLKYVIDKAKAEGGGLTDPRNLLRDSAMMTFGTSEFPFYTENQTGTGIFSYEDNPWAGKQLRFRCNVGVRTFWRQYFTQNYNGEPVSMGVFYKRISGSANFFFRISSGSTSTGGQGVSVDFGDPDGWLFRKIEGVSSSTITGPCLFNIEIDNRSGSDDTEFLFAYPMLTPSNSIDPTMRDGVSFQINSLKQQIGSHWAGKEILTYGDSITAAGNNATVAPWIITGGLASWQAMVCSQIGFSRHYGRGIGGQTVKWNTSTWFANANGEYVNRPPATQPPNTTVHLGAFCSWDRISTMIPETFSGIILIMGGANDAFGQESVIEDELPEFSSTNTTDTHWVSSGKYIGGDFDITKFKGALASTIMKIQIQAPNAIIVLMTPTSGRGNDDINNQNNQPVNGLGNMMIDYANAVIEISQYMSVPFIDMFRNTGINQINRTRYISDIVHPNSGEGSEAMARAVIGGLQTIYPKFL